MRTHINLYMVALFTTIISTTLIAQDSIEEITVTSSYVCLLYTSPSPRDATLARMPSSA